MKKILVSALLTLAFSISVFASSYTWSVPVIGKAGEQEIKLNSLGNLSGVVVVVTGPYTCKVSTVKADFSARCGGVGTNEIARQTNVAFETGTVTLNLNLAPKSKSIYIEVAGQSLDGKTNNIAITATEGDTSKSTKPYYWNIPVLERTEEQTIEFSSVNPLSTLVVTAPAGFTGTVYTIKDPGPAVVGTLYTNNLVRTVKFTNGVSATSRTLYFAPSGKRLYIVNESYAAKTLDIVGIEGSTVGQNYSWNIPLLLRGYESQSIRFDTPDALTGLVVVVDSVVTCSYSTASSGFPATCGETSTNNIVTLVTASVYTNDLGATQASTNSIAIPDLVKTRLLTIKASGATASNETTAITLKVNGKAAIVEKKRFIPF